MHDALPDRQPPHVLAAWIAELLHELRAMQVRRLAQLRGQMHDDVFATDNTTLAFAVAAVQSATRDLRLRDLRAGWIDKLLGKHRAAYARFTAGCERVASCAAELKTEAAEVAERSKPTNAGARRAMVELEIELNALQAEVERAVTWLQDMCAQLARLSPAAASDADVQKLVRAAHGYTDQLKRLQSVSTLTRDARVRGMDVLTRRSALLDQVRADVDALERTWMRAIGKIAAELKARRDPAAAAARAMEPHDELLKRLSLTSDSCSALQHEEHLFAQQLVTLRQEIEALR